ncbi:MAG: MYG1 family protein [Candidatus Paceibacterota bacterium]|jgi:uncharacterized UPF0160 family protein
MVPILFKRKVKVAVHNGCFHPDDICAVAILSLYLEKPLKISRTRDPEVWAKMDYVLDVGGEYDPEKRMFDHHQEGWDMKRENGIKYAATGLLWKHFGEKISGSKEVAQKIDEKIIQPIDAEDNGIELCKNSFEGISSYSFGDYLFSFNPTWKGKGDSIKAFEDAVSEAKKMFVMEIRKAKDNLIGADIVKDIYNKTEDKRIIVLDNDYSWKKILINYPEPLFVVSQKSEDGTWSAVAVNKLHGSKFEVRMSFPESWKGMRDEALAKMTGVSDAIFCHNGRFIAVARSKEGAIKLAEKAIASYN